MTKRKFVKVYFRIKPEEKMTWDHLKILDDHKTIYVRSLQQLNKSRENVVPAFWIFHTDYVFFNDSQTQIYETIAPEILNDLLQGQDAIIMAYGQTGAGKSLTINGLYNSFEERGLLPRLTSDLFQTVKKETAENNKKVCIQVSHVEFVKSTMYDLLKSYPNHCQCLKEIIKEKVKSVEETLDIVFRGEGRKLFSENPSYPSHSCSSIFTFYINMKNTEMQNSIIEKCKLHVIDLAGADNVGNLTCLFKNPQDVGAANLAKSQLEQFFLKLSSNSPDLKLEQRLNPMINYLGDSLKKTTNLRVIGHIQATRENLLIAISMLRFGELIGGLKVNKYEVNIDKYACRRKIDCLEEELMRLKLENKHNATFLHHDLSKSLNEERLGHVERMINEYLQNKITHLTLLNVCDVNIALEIFKMMFKKCEEERKESSSLTKMKKTSITSNNSKSHQKSSRGSSRTSSDLKKISEDKELPRRTKSASASGDLPKIDKISSHHDTSKTRPKTSSSSILKRSSSHKRKSGSSASIIRHRSKSKSLCEDILMPDIPPEYNEAWAAYVQERNEEYAQILDLYKANEAKAKTVYTTYLSELEKLKEIMDRVDKYKNDLLMAKLTREFQHAECKDSDVVLSDFERCCKEQLERGEQEKLQNQETVLKSQALLKFHINFCNEKKKDLNEKFSSFCREKYQVTVVNLEENELVEMDVVKSLKEEEEKNESEIPVENREMMAYERCKSLIDSEQRKKKIYLLKHRDWLN